MLGRTHLLYGAVTGLAIGSGDLKILGLTMLGSIISDIDHPNSMVGRNVPIIPKLLPHRGPTHSLLFIVVCLLLNVYFGIGVAVHCILDMMTKNGIHLFWPLKWNVRFPLAKFVSTGGIFEIILQCVGVIAFILLALHCYVGLDIINIF